MAMASPASYFLYPHPISGNLLYSEISPCLKYRRDGYVTRILIKTVVARHMYFRGLWKNSCILMQLKLFSSESLNVYMHIISETLGRL